MDKASAHGAGDCRLESCRGHCSNHGCAALHECLRPCIYACRLKVQLITSKPVQLGLKGTWCSGITSAPHAEGPGFKSQCVHLLHMFKSKCSNSFPMASPKPPTAHQLVKPMVYQFKALGKFLYCKEACGPVAQWIRHRPTEPGIAGSRPAGVIAPIYCVLWYMFVSDHKRTALC